MASAEKKSWWGRAFSLVRYYMENRTPTVFAVIVIALMLANLGGMIHSVRLQKQILAQGVTAIQPQSMQTEWYGSYGMRHTVTTPRKAVESPSSLSQRHSETVAAFFDAYPPDPSK